MTGRSIFDLRTILLLLLCRQAGGLRTPVAVFTSKACLSHEPGWLIPEAPKRLAALYSAAYNEWAAEFGAFIELHEPEADVTEEQLLRVHTAAHLQKLAAAFGRTGGFPLPNVNLDADTVVSPGSRVACTRASGLVVAAVDEVLGAESATRRSFCMLRPPGHHAEPERAMGFCIYNNVMVGVAHAQAAHGVGRVAVLDFDVHHGNGCAAMVRDHPDRLYASSHQRGLFPLGVSAFTPEGGGRAGTHGNVLSSVLPAGSGSDAFFRAWREDLLPQVEAFEPEAIFISAGFDGARTQSSAQPHRPLDCGEQTRVAGLVCCSRVRTRTRTPPHAPAQRTQRRRWRRLRCARPTSSVSLRRSRASAAASCPSSASSREGTTWRRSRAAVGRTCAGSSTQNIT